MIVLIGFRKRVTKPFSRALFHAFLLSLLFILLLNLAVLIICACHGDLSDVTLWMRVSIVPFYIIHGDVLLLLFWPLSWATYIGLMACFLHRIGKSQNRRLRMTGTIGTVVVFAGIYVLCFYFTARAVAAAIAIGAMMMSM